MWKRTELTILALSLLSVAVQRSAGVDLNARDLNPVTLRAAPAQPPVVLVEKGQAHAMIWNAAGGDAREIQRSIKEATGAELPIESGTLRTPAIVIGDCELAKQHGLDSSTLPAEGFIIKTAPGVVFIVGNGQGLQWGCYEFCERFVGVRWYWPTDLGRSVPRADTLSVPPVWLEDAPVFRKREMWPPTSNSWNGTGTPLTPVQTFLRGGNSWPVNLRVHQPDWSRVDDYVQHRPEVFQLRSDGTRDTSMICYGNPRTLATYLENLERACSGQQPAYVPVDGSAITVSPNDAEIACHCPDCRRLWNESGGQYGSASKILATFVVNLGREVKKRWPDKTIIFLPYLNYTLAPDGIPFPDNVEVQICGMPGMAMYKEPSVLADEQANVEKWVKLSGRKIQNWHYSCWPENRTSAVFQYPHVVKAYYQQNRDRTIGTFINGETDHWPRQNITLYCWLKVLWNPEFDIDAATAEFCERMFGPVATTMREVLHLQMAGWEESRWPSSRLSAKAIHETSYPRLTVLRLAELLDRARTEAAADGLALQRVEYYAAPFAAFFEDSKNFAAGGGLRPLLVQKVGENPKLDGKLDDDAWQRAAEIPFIRGWDKATKEPRYPTTVKGVWTAAGVTFGFHLVEPAPELLEAKIKGRDDSMLWWDDNVELLFDVTGKNEGEFYHFIVSALNTVADFKGRDLAWNTDQVTSAVLVGKDFWSAEVFVPFAAFPEAVRPAGGSASQVQWYGNFTRHRVCAWGLKPPAPPVAGGEREYSRMNTTYADPSDNLADFAPIKFVE
jgi:hypothetical protein